MGEENINTNSDGQKKEVLIDDNAIAITDGNQPITDDDENEDSGQTSDSDDANAQEDGEDDDTDSDEDKKINQEAVNKKINKVIKDKKIAEKVAADERRQRLEVEARLKELTQAKLPDVPPIPNYMDPNYELLMQARDEILVKHARAKAVEESLHQLAQDKANQEALAHQQHIQETIKAFDKRTEELKLDKTTLIDSQNTVGSFIEGKADLARFLLADENGPLNVLYLSQNIVELEKISKMPQTDAAVYIATVIAPKAQGLKPKQTKTPAPPYNANRRTKEVDDDPNLEGCKFR